MSCSYYDELSAKAKNLGDYNIAQLCAQLDMHCKKLPKDKSSEIDEWLYVLMYHHKVLSKEDIINPVYKPKTLQMVGSNNGAKTLVYELGQLPETLLPIIAQYIIDVINN
jgi:hypothetical protein